MASAAYHGWRYGDFQNSEFSPSLDISFSLVRLEVLDCRIGAEEWQNMAHTNLIVRAEKLLPTVNQPKSLCQHNTLHKGVLLSVSPTRAVIIILTMHSSCHHTATAIRLICIWLNPFSTMTFPQAGYQGIPGFTGVISRTRS
jgi:hypothetical protein